MLLRVLRLLWSSSAGWTSIGTVLLAFEIAASLASLYIVKQLVESLTAAAGSAGTGSVSDTWPVLQAVALTGFFTFAYLTARSLGGFAREVQGLRVAEHVDRQIHQKAIEVDLAFYESPRYFDTLKRARDAGSHRPAQVVNHLLLAAKNILMLVAILALIWTINWILLPILVIALVPALLGRLYFARTFYDWRKRRTQLDRRANYFDYMITSDRHAKELRLGQLGEHFVGLFSGIKRQIRLEQLRISKRRLIFDIAIVIVATLAFFGALAQLAIEATRGQNSVGDLVLFLLIFQRAQTVGQELIQQISAIYEDHLYVGQLFDFLDVSPISANARPIRAIPEVPSKGLSFEDVSFSYPGCEQSVLKNLSLSIRPGQIVGLVGANGSGKTTLIKLLCGLYEPTRGRVTLEGHDIRVFERSEYRRLFGVVFQDYVQYAETAAENIRYGDIRRTIDDPRIGEAGRLSGAGEFVGKLKHGYDTVLSRMFDGGVDLSVGQWQKLAIARSLFPQSKFIVLDEPSSALDSRAEHELFSDFRRTIGCRAALVISHRLSTIAQCDVVYVLEHGQIQQTGTVRKLLAVPGRFRDLFGEYPLSADRLSSA